MIPDIRAVPLPEHWEMKIDPVTGWPFFVDHVHQLTTWDDPRYRLSVAPGCSYPPSSSRPPQEAVPIVPANPWHVTYQYPQVADQLKPSEQKKAEEWSGPQVESENILGHENSQHIPRETPAQMHEKLRRIEQIRCKVDGIRQKAERYVGHKNSKEYVHIEETLMSYLLELDTIETLGSGLVRSARKSVVKTIQSLQDLLESRATPL